MRNLKYTDEDIESMQETIKNLTKLLVELTFRVCDLEKQAKERNFDDWK